MLKDFYKGRYQNLEEELKMTSETTTADIPWTLDIHKSVTHSDRVEGTDRSSTNLR